MATVEPFTIIEDEGSRPQKLFDDYQKLTSGKTTDLDVQVVTALREQHPDLIVTSVPSTNCNLLQFAAAGFATADLDTDTEPVLRWRGFVGPSHRGGSGYLADATFFAKYHYKWGNEDFILYTVVVGYGTCQYILKEKRGNETPFSNSAVTDALLASIGAWLIKEEPAIYVYDGYWTRSTQLWKEVWKASWDDVILEPKMKKALTEVSGKFFDSMSSFQFLFSVCSNRQQAVIFTKCTVCPGRYVAFSSSPHLSQTLGFMILGYLGVRANQGNSAV